MNLEDTNCTDKRGKNLAFFKLFKFELEDLIDRGLDINRKDDNGCSPLMYHIMRGNIAQAEFLIDLGADVNVLYRDLTPLALSVRLMHSTLARKLYEKGSMPEVINEKYALIQVIGSTGKSKVFAAQTKTETVAIKEILFDETCEIEVLTINNEIDILSQLDHPYITKILDISKCGEGYKSRYHIVLEYAKYDLYDIIRRYPTEFSNVRIRHYMAQICSAVYHCHSVDILHMDLKTSNILVTDYGMVKLADFGLSYELGTEEIFNTYITVNYRPPEMLVGSNIPAKSADVWSLGCVFAEMIMKELFFTGMDEICVLESIFSILGSVSESVLPGITDFFSESDLLDMEPKDLSAIFPNFPQDGLDLLNGMLQIKAGDRYKMLECVKHPYFDVFFK